MELSRSEWAEHLERWRRSGQTAKEYCEERGLKFGALRYWSGRIGRGRPPRPEEPTVRFATIQRQTPTATRAPAPSWSGVRLRVGEAEVALERGFDDETLTRVVAVLSGREAT